MRPDPITVAVAATIALLAAYLVADLVARLVQGALRSIIKDDQLETLFVDRPQRITRLVIFLVTAAALLLPALRYAGLDTQVGGSPEALARWAMDAGLRIAVIAVAAYLTIRMGSAAARRFEREVATGTGLDVLERRKRAQTLGQLIQKTISVLVTSVAALMILRELDVDIMPVLTGAGIVGLAVGFGSQTLVRDILSGFFLILEDQVRVGDVAVVNGQGGLVEQVNLRTIVLRDENGTVHVIPNGEVKTLSNMSKDFSYFVFSLPISYEEDPETVVTALKEIGAALQADEAFRPHILDPIDVYGVEALEAGQFVVKGRIKTVPMKQWTVGRELRRRIADGFKARNIQMPRPTMHHYFETPLATRGDTAARGGTENTTHQGTDTPRS